MIRLETINFIMLIISSFIVYIPTVTLAGFFSAWISKKLGDDTAQKNGFLSLNPIKHVDYIGMILMLIPPFLGVSRGIPLNTNNINKVSPWKKLKTFILFFSNMIGFLLVFVLLLFFVIIFQHKILPNIISLPFSVKELPSSLIVVASLLKTTFRLTTFCLILHFFGAVVKSFIHFFVPDFENESNYLIGTFIFSILLFMIFGSYIEYLIGLFIINIDKLFSYLLF